MEHQSSPIILQDNHGRRYFDKQLVQRITGKMRAKKLVPFLKNANISDSFDSNGNSLLHIAAQCENDDVVRYLIQSGCRIDAQNYAGKTPLIVAIENRRLISSLILLEQKGDIFICDNSGKNALNWFLDVQWSDQLSLASSILAKVKIQCRRNNEEIAKKLLDAGWPLYNAILLKNLEVTKMMLNRGCAVDARDPKNGRTALHVAVMTLDVKHVKLLLDNKADPNVMDKVYRTPLAMLSPCSYPDRKKEDEVVDVVKSLIDRGAALITTNNHHRYHPEQNQVERLSKFGNSQVIEVLLQANLDLSRNYQEYPNPLYTLASNTNPGVFESLVEHVSLQELLGKHIAEFIYERIRSNPPSNDHYNFCKKQLDVKLYKSMTLLDLLSKSDFEFERCARNQELASIIEQFNKESQTKLHYFNTILQKRYSKAVQRLKLRKKTACHLCQMMKTDYSRYPLIADEIVSYLDEQDLQNFLLVQL